MEIFRISFAVSEILDNRLMNPKPCIVASPVIATGFQLAYHWIKMHTR